MKIEKLDYYGRGITYFDGKICFVSNALEQEDVSLKLLKKKKKYCEAEVALIKHKSQNRVQPKCPYYLKCGGCHLLHMKEEKRNQFKQNKVYEVLRDVLASKTQVKDLEVSFSTHYRNKAVFHIKNSKIGFFKKKTNELVEISSCLLLNQKINSLIPLLKEFLKEERDINKITVKVGNQTSEVMIIIDGKSSSYQKLLNHTNVFMIANQVITKKNSIFSIIGSKKYQISKNSFFQVNEFMVEKLYEEVLENIKKNHSKRVLDLYCGTGTIAIYISDFVEKVVGIEVVEDAIIDANNNKRINHAKNVEFILGKVEDKIEQLEDDFDTIIVDPPRSGLDKKTIQIIEKIKARNIIYVSCDLFTLARDLKELKNTYDILSIKPFDMFPNTYHVECVCVLSRQ